MCTSLRAGLKVGVEMVGAATAAPVQVMSHATSRRLMVGTWVNNPGFDGPGFLVLLSRANN